MKFIQPMIVTAMFLLPTSPAFPQGAGIEWDILTQEVASLYRNGQYDRAVVVAKKALEVAEKNAGPNHPDLATSLNNLALLYKDQGEYAQAERLYKRSLAIDEKALGPDYPDVAISLNNLAALYDTQGQYALAEPLFKRSLAIPLPSVAGHRGYGTRCVSNSNVARSARAKGGGHVPQTVQAGIIPVDLCLGRRD